MNDLSPLIFFTGLKCATWFSFRMILVQGGVFLCIFLYSGSVSCSKVPAHVEPSRLSVVLRKGFLSAGVIHVFRFLKTPQPKTQRYDSHDRRCMSIRPTQPKSDLH